MRRFDSACIAGCRSDLKVSTDWLVQSIVVILPNSYCSHQTRQLTLGLYRKDDNPRNGAVVRTRLARLVM
jgi:hypothetical protein